MIIVSNVSIFASMPPFAMFIEQYHTVDERENEMVRKMTIFQCVNTVAAALSFCWCLQLPGARSSTCSEADLLEFGSGDPRAEPWACAEVQGFFNRDWYWRGGYSIFNILVGDKSSNGSATRVPISHTPLLPLQVGDILAIVLIVEGLRVFDAVPLRYLFAPRQPTQHRMNLWFTLRAPFYLPYRMQLVNKYIIIGIGFSSALPALYPVLFLFFQLTSYRHSTAPTLTTYPPPTGALPLLRRVVVRGQVEPAAAVRLARRPRHHREDGRIMHARGLPDG